MPAAVIQLPHTAIPLPLKAIADFCRRWAVRELALFGSVLRPDDFGPDSDIDVMVTFQPELKTTLLTLDEMEEELRSIFGRDVDLLTRPAVEQSLNWYRRRAILNTAEVVYAYQG